MKKGFLRCIAVIMIVLMAAVYVPVMDVDDAFSISASALISKNNAMGSSNAKWSYDTSNKTRTISGSGAIPDYTDTPSAFAKYNAKLVVTIVNNAKKIVVENGITSIGNYVFKGFKNVTNISIPASVTNIGASAFEGCSGLTSISLPSNLKTIGANAFKNTKISSFTIPASVTSIGAGAFSGISGLKITCNYATEAYKYCLQNSISCALPENVLVSDVSMDTANKQIKVVLKMAYNKAQFNAGNFTLTYSGAVTPVSTETVYNSANGIATAVVYNGNGKISVAMMAENYVPYSSNVGICDFTFAEIRFNVVGQDATADFSFAADTLMMNNAKTSIKSASGNVVLHVYEEKVEKEASCVADGLKVIECPLCGLVKESIVVPKDSSKHINTEVKNKKDATCSAAGYTGDTVCKDCGAVVATGSEVAATGTHDYEKVVTAATCTATGYTTYTCKVCANAYKGDFTAALGHDFAADGKCSRCAQVAVVSVTFKDNTGYVVNDETKVVIIKKSLNADELKTNIASGNWVVADAKGNTLEGTAIIKTGCSLKAGNADVTYTVIILGDANSDGKVNSADARILLRAGAKLQTLTEIEAIAADVNNDGKVNSADARVALRVGAKLQTL